MCPITSNIFTEKCVMGTLNRPHSLLLYLGLHQQSDPDARALWLLGYAKQLLFTSVKHVKTCDYALL